MAIQLPLARLETWSRKLPTGLAGAAFWLVIAFIVTWLLAVVTGGESALLFVLQVLIGIVSVGVAIPLLLRVVRTRMLWSLRNKLIVTYLLIGLAPVVLFVTLMTISTYIAAGQFAIHLVDTRVQAELDQLSTDTAYQAAHAAYFTAANTLDEANKDAPRAADGERTATLGSQRLHHRRYTEAFLDGAPVPPPAGGGAAAVSLGLPPWAISLKDGELHSIVLDGDELFLVALRQRRLSNGRMFTLLSSLPVGSALMDEVAEGLGRAKILAVRTTEASRLSAKAQRQRSISGGTEPPPLSLADVRVRFFSTTAVTDWDTGGLDNVPVDVVSRPSLLYLQLFGGSLSGVVTSAIRVGLISLCILFGAIEALALIMAVRLSRTMTASVADLYDATLHIDRGDLEHRIAVSRSDQLAELSRSFNRMTGSLQRLLEEQKEKERLQNELSIAQEVQANLFPISVRNLPTLELHGVCRPARSVSGDYYDFLIFFREDHLPGLRQKTESGVGIALGDISGKGISAALLMATLHSAVRAYQFAGEEKGVSAAERNGSAEQIFSSPGRIMELLNRHLYRSTQPEKYATLFLAHYDAATAWLTYSTAGQLPPLLLGRDNSVRRLDCGGTVVGLMDGMKYDEGRFLMHPGDILVAYSDGVTEPENDFGDFGEERLMEVVRRYRDQPLHVISSQVMQALDAWIGADEQPDDITLVLARQV